MLRRAKTLTQQAADEIRERIVAGEFDLGTPLSENALAAELGVSKTPVREAMLQLKVEGLVDIHPQRGSFVFDMTPTQITELGELRRILELAAVDLACERDRGGLLTRWQSLLAEQSAAIETGDYTGYRNLDSTFHDVPFELCGNTMLQDSFRNVAFRIQALRRRLSVQSNLNEESLIEHREIVARLEAGDLAGLRERLVAHMQGTIWKFHATLGQRGTTAA